MLDVSAQNKNLTTLHILRGENPLLESIAKIVGVSRSRLSQLSQSVTEGGYRQIKKMLVLLVKAINKTNIPKNAFSELSDEAKWFIEEWLPNFHKYVEEGQNIDEIAQEVEVLIESFGPPEKSALPETSSNLLVEDYQKGHKHFRLEVTGCYLGKIKDAVDEILIEFSNGIREIVSPRYCLAVK